MSSMLSKKVFLCASQTSHKQSHNPSPNKFLQAEFVDKLSQTKNILKIYKKMLQSHSKI